MSKSITHVSDVFGFSLKHGRLTNAMFFDGVDYPDFVDEVQREVIGRAQSHVEASARALLKAVDSAILDDDYLGTRLSHESKTDSYLDKYWYIDRHLKEVDPKLWLWFSIRQDRDEPDAYTLRLGIWLRQSRRDFVMATLRDEILRESKYLVTCGILDVGEGQAFSSIAASASKRAIEFVKLLESAVQREPAD